MKINHSKKLTFLGKITLTLIIVFILFKYQLIDIGLLKNINGHLGPISVALICLFTGTSIGALRWKQLIDAANVPFNWKTVLQLYFIGNFFSSYFPGAAGGDAMRAFYIYRLLDTGRSVALLTMFTDRIFSLFGLLSAATLIYAICPAAIRNNCILLIYGQITFFLLLSAVFIIILCFFCASYIQKKGWNKFFPDQISRFLNPILAITMLYRRKWLTLLYCLLLSIIASVIVALSILSFSSLFTFKPRAEVSLIACIYANLSSAIPLTPGGIGVGEAVFSKVATDLSGIVAPFATIYFMFRIGVMIVNIPGFLVYLMFDSSTSRKKLTSNSYQVAVTSDYPNHHLTITGE